MGFVAHRVTPRNALHLRSTPEVPAGLAGSAARCDHEPSFSSSRDTRPPARGQELPPAGMGSTALPIRELRGDSSKLALGPHSTVLGEQEKLVCHHPHSRSPHHPKYTLGEMRRHPERTAELRSQSHPSPSVKSFLTNARGQRCIQSARNRRENGERRAMPCWAPNLPVLGNRAGTQKQGGP